MSCKTVPKWDKMISIHEVYSHFLEVGGQYIKELIISEYRISSTECLSNWSIGDHLRRVSFRLAYEVNWTKVSQHFKSRAGRVNFTENGDFK